MSRVEHIVIIVSPTQTVQDREALKEFVYDLTGFVCPSNETYFTIDVIDDDLAEYMIRNISTMVGIQQVFRD